MYVSSVPNLQGQYCFTQKDIKGYFLQVSLYGKGWGFDELKYIYERFAKSTIDMFKWTNTLTEPFLNLGVSF